VVLEKKNLRGKAPAGRDGIPIEFYQSVLVMERRIQKEPKSTLGKILYRLMKECWECSRVPECWDTASVISIPKKGW